jgi:adenine deaminase
MSQVPTSPTPEQLAARIRQAVGRHPPALVIKNAPVLDLVGGELITADIAITGDRIVGVDEGYAGRREIDARGLVAVPGFVDAHVHVESSLITPAEFDRAVLPRGTTTAVCDPHEISNVLGVPGLQFFLDSAQCPRVGADHAHRLVSAGACEEPAVPALAFPPCRPPHGAERNAHHRERGAGDP